MREPSLSTVFFFGAGLAWAEASIRYRRERKSRAHLLANRVVIAIDRFVDDCVLAIQSQPHPLDDNTDPETHAPFPNAYVEPGDVDWASIRGELADKLLSIPGQDRDARTQVRGLAEYDSSVRTLRDQLFKRLALEVNDLADQLRRDYTIPKSPEGPWGAADALRKWRDGQGRIRS